MASISVPFRSHITRGIKIEDTASIQDFYRSKSMFGLDFIMRIRTNIVVVTIKLLLRMLQHLTSPWCNGPDVGLPIYG